MTPKIEALADGLSDLERDLLLEKPSSWGSWMWGVANGLIAKGLARKSGFGTTITFDTSLGLAVRRLLQEREGR